MSLVEYSFSKIVKDITSHFAKIKKGDYLEEGEIPIIDQGAGFVAGYTNQSKISGFRGVPLILFGDHTRILKYVDFPFTIGADGVKVLSVDPDVVYPKFLYYQLKSINIPSAGYSRHFKFIKNSKLQIPESLADQKRIAYVLSRCEELIAKRKESIALLDDYVKSVFLEMFGDPVKNEKGWNEEALSQLGTIDRGMSKHRPRNAPELLGGNHPLIQTGDVSNSGTYIKNYKHTYSDVGLAQSKKWPIGTLCITIAANIAKTGILTFDACFPDSVVGFIPKEKKSTTLYVHYLFSFLQRLLEYNAPSSAQKNINLNILRNLLVPKPSYELQLTFNSIVEKVEAIKNQYQTSLTELENLYGSLSQRAFSDPTLKLRGAKGGVDVALSAPDIQKVVEESTKQLDSELSKRKKLLDDLGDHVKGFESPSQELQRSRDEQEKNELSEDDHQYVKTTDFNFGSPYPTRRSDLVAEEDSTEQTAINDISMFLKRKGIPKIDKESFTYLFDTAMTYLVMKMPGAKNKEVLNQSSIIRFFKWKENFDFEYFHHACNAFSKQNFNYDELRKLVFKWVQQDHYWLNQYFDEEEKVMKLRTIMPSS